VTGLVDQVVAVHRSLASANIDHAFGGALALAYCTSDPRGTADIDVNVFVPPEEADRVFSALPVGVQIRARDRIAALRDGQVRLWWGETPVDVFFGYHPFHAKAAGRAHAVPFGEERIPVLGCIDVAVFKAMFGRTKDWADIEAMAAAGLDGGVVSSELSDLLGRDDERVARLAEALATGSSPPAPDGELVRRGLGRPPQRPAAIRTPRSRRPRTPPSGRSHP
jgi:hypothetical protein